MDSGWVVADDMAKGFGVKTAKWNDALVKSIFKQRSKNEGNLAGVTREIEGQQKALDDATVDSWQGGHFEEVKGKPSDIELMI